jgi:hypothetical protein
VNALAFLAVASLLLLSRGALADDSGCDPSRDGSEARGCTRFIVPAIVATSSIQPYASLNISAGWRSSPTPPFAGVSGNSLSQATLTASPQFGLALAPFSLIYFGADGGLAAGLNEGSLLGQGGVFTGDYIIGLVLQYHTARWRYALNSRLLRGQGAAIQAEGLVEGVTANFTNAELIPALQDLAKGVKDVLLPYTITSGRFDFAVAYDLGSVTLQGAFGIEAIRDDFSPNGSNQLQRIVTTTFPRLGLAFGFDPNEAFEVTWFPVALLAEYQLTVNKSWVDLSGQTSSVSSPSIPDSVAALGFYLPRALRNQEDLQLGFIAFDDFGHASNLVSSGTQGLASGLAQELGVIASFRYFF